MSIFIKRFTCNYISRGARWPGPPGVDAGSFTILAYSVSLPARDTAGGGCL